MKTTTAATIGARFAAWLEARPPAELARLGAELARGLERDGLTVYHAAEDHFTPIAPSLTPEPIDDAELSELALDAERLLRATAKACLWTLGDDGRSWAETLYAWFTPLEHACLRRDPRRLLQVATARVDYFRGPDGVARALELNATIPAMQGYSDILAHRWLRLLGAGEEQVAAAGSNTRDLIASLDAHYRLAGGRAAHPSIVIVSRRGDSQLGELRHYERVFTEAGYPARHVYVDELELDASGRVAARGQTFDLVYRHIFARRLEEGSVLARLLLDPGPNIVLNPVLSPLEVKGVLALLLTEPRLPLDDEERDVVRRRVPWTRLCRPGPGTTPDGEPVGDLVTWAAASPERLVLKRSWDYGGKGVFIGPDAASEAPRARMRELYGDGVDGWAALVDRAAADPNVWVLQELVPPPAVRHLLVVRDAAGTPVPAWHEVFVDVNAYACLGVAARPRGGVSRASSSKIVNIAGGGGVVPLVKTTVLEDLLRALPPA